MSSKLDTTSAAVFVAFALIIGYSITVQIIRILPNSIGVNIDERLPAEKICMVNDAYMGRKQIEVPVGGKIYYGCCQMCVTKLQSERDSRFSKDPYSGEEVDKVEAYIVLKKKRSDGVLYFKSKENFEKYLAEKN